MKYETFQALFKHAPMINHPTASTQKQNSRKVCHGNGYPKDF